MIGGFCTNLEDFGAVERWVCRLMGMYYLAMYYRTNKPIALVSGCKNGMENTMST